MAYRLDFDLRQLKENEHLICSDALGKRRPNSESRIPTEVCRDCDDDG